MSVQKGLKPLVNPARIQAYWFRLFLLCVAVLLSSSPARADAFLEAEQAFPASVSAQGADWTVEFRVAPGYYLYRDKIAVKRSDGQAGQAPQVDIPAGVRKFDENLGKEVETLRDTVRISVRWLDAPPASVDVHSQGCADAGLCYPPMVQTLKPVSAIALGADESSALASRLQSGNTAWVLAAFFGLGVLLAFTPCVLPMVPILSAVIVGQQGSAASVTGASGQSAAAGRWRSLALAMTYVAGMSIVYTAVGVAAGLTGQGLVAALQTPAVLYTFAAFLFAFGVAMLGAWDLQLPLFIQNWVNEKSSRLQGGRLAPVFLMGGLSAVLVGPCVAPPLAGALLYLSTTGDWLLGGAALMALSWGLGAPLIVAAAAADRVLPRAGAWMESVKRFFGFLLMALAIYTAAPVLPTRLLMALWSVFLLISAAWAGALQLLPAGAGAVAKLRQGLAWVMLLLGLTQGLGAIMGATDVFNPMGPLLRSGHPGVALDAGASSSASTQSPAVASASDPSPGNAPSPFSGSRSALSLGGSQTQGDAARSAPASSASGLPAISPNPHGLPFRRVAAGDVDAVIASLRQPAFLDFYAEWCVSCKEMERFTFTDARVQKALQGVVWLQVDVTDNTLDDRALLKRYRLFGPPGIVFFDARGQEIAGARVVGFQDAAKFEQTVRQVYPR